VWWWQGWGRRLFAAIACAEAAPGAEVVLLEKGRSFYRRSASGRWPLHVTHAVWIRASSRHIIRAETGDDCLLRRFQAQDTGACSSRAGEAQERKDGRMFRQPTLSQTIMDASWARLGRRCEAALNRGVESVAQGPDGAFELKLSDGSAITGDRLLLPQEDAECGLASGVSLATHWSRRCFLAPSTSTRPWLRIWRSVGWVGGVAVPGQACASGVRCF